MPLLNGDPGNYTSTFFVSKDINNSNFYQLLKNGISQNGLWNRYLRYCENKLYMRHPI